jgi:hypothetical protein
VEGVGVIAILLIVEHVEEEKPQLVKNKAGLVFVSQEMRNRKMKNIFTYLLIFILMLFSCDRPDFNNPFDGQADPSTWKPKNLSAVIVSDSKLQLTWQQDVNLIDGFNIYRKINNDQFNLLTHLSNTFRAYIDTELEKCFVDIVRELEESLRVDSSNLTLDEWLKLAFNIKEHLKDKIGEIDEQFSREVRCVMTNPFMKDEEYIGMFNRINDGIILLCYGAGNGNIELNGNYSVIPAIRKANKEKKIVVISSQVSLETYDFEYEAGRLLLENGAIPSGSLSYPEAQIKLSYILGHSEIIDKILQKYPNLNRLQLTKAAFLSGIKFERTTSKKKYEKISKRTDPNYPIRIMNYDPFCDTDKNFVEAIEEVAKFLT